jgi:hypothetical protein
MNRNLGFGGSLFLIALGAILAFGVTVDAEGFNLNTIGMILMGVGGLGVILTLVAMNTPEKRERSERVVKDVDIERRDD